MNAVESDREMLGGREPDLDSPLVQPSQHGAPGRNDSVNNLRSGNLVGVTASLRCEIFPADLEATVHFYVEVLGFCLVRDERTAENAYIAVERGHVRLGAAARPEVDDREMRRPPLGVELVLEVDDVDGERTRVAAANWPVTEELMIRPWGLRDFRLLDPSGYYWRITSSRL
jgi:lactoylglutathione lyase